MVIPGKASYGVKQPLLTAALMIAAPNSPWWKEMVFDRLMSLWGAGRVLQNWELNYVALLFDCFLQNIIDREPSRFL